MNNHRILFVGLVWPEPKSSAASQNILSYINLFIKQGFDITFACAAEKTEQSAVLSSLGINEQKIRLNDSSFDSFIAQLQPTITVFDRFISEEQFGWRVSEAAPNCLKILDCEDLHFLRDARHKAYKADKDSSDFSLVSPYLYSDICKRELASILRCDLSLLLSPVELDLLHNIFRINCDILHYCPFLIPNTKKKPFKTYQDRVDFVSIGSFRHAPNWDAVLTLKKHIWPSIHKAIPKAKLHIYGSYLTPKAKQLENKKEGFLVHGFAPDAFNVIRNARVLLAPLNFGAGIKGKLVDAMQCGTPSVTTDIGAEGLRSSAQNKNTIFAQAISANNRDLKEKDWPGAIYNICQNESSFSKVAIELYSSQKEWEQASAKTDTQFSSIFNYDAQSEALLEKIEDCLVNLKEHRQRNFLGQVMQHHSVMSTKYMSQWIEAKNRSPSPR
jgi:glycosyltransferase involved in cell wall biosynthesis